MVDMQLNKQTKLKLIGAVSRYRKDYSLGE